MLIFSDKTRSFVWIISFLHALELGMFIPCLLPLILYFYTLFGHADYLISRCRTRKL